MDGPHTSSDKALNRFRAMSASVAVLAVLLYLNTSQIDDDSESSLHSAGASSTSVSRVLLVRREEAVANAWIEYGALVTAGFGVAVALGASRVTRAWSSVDRRRRTPND